MLVKKDKFSLIIGEDVITHPNYKTLAKLCAMIDKYTKFDILIIPTKTNTLGVSLICQLDEKVEGFAIGYNEKADYELSALGDGNLDMPALNQQEGTFVNIDKRVVPTNAALPYKGYILNDIANELLSKKQEYTIDYTSKLPTTSGFKQIEFDSLANYFSNDANEHRGYILDNIDVQIDNSFEKTEILNVQEHKDEFIIYRANPMNLFNEFVAKSHEFERKAKTGIYMSEKLFNKLQLEQNSKVRVLTKNKTFDLDVFIDEQIDGEIAYVSTFDKSYGTKELFDSYRFIRASLTKA